jgi:hypothetical protein
MEEYDVMIPMVVPEDKAANNINSTSKAQRWRLIYLVLVISINVCLMTNHAYDDPFITYRYADNLRRGLGFVYNSGERVLSTTTPLYALLLTGLSYIWPNLPHLSNFISAVSVALSGLFLFHLGRRWEAPVAGIAGAALLPFFPLLLSTFGAETCLYIMLILASFLLYAGDKPLWAMVPAALATLTRSDGVLIAGVLGLATLVHERRFPWRMALVYGGLIAPWYLFSWSYFGSPFPVTLAAKQHQASMAISEGFAKGFLTTLAPYLRRPLYWLHGGFFFLGTIYAVAKKWRWLHLLLWGVLYFLGYTVLGVSRYFWYYAPLVPVIIAMSGLGVQWFHDHLPAKWENGWQRWAVIVILLVLMLWPQSKGVRWLSTHTDNRYYIYRSVGEWLADNSSSDASVGTLEVGIIGYYARRRMIGFAGLLQPEVAQQMTTDATYQDTAQWAIATYRPDYLVLSATWFPVVQERMIQPHCKDIKNFTHEDYPDTLQVYKCDFPTDFVLK